MASDDDLFIPENSVIKNLGLRNDSVFLGTKVTNKAAALILNVSESHLSSWKKENMQRAFYILAAHGMKVVPKDATALPVEDLKHYMKQARRMIDHDMAELPDTQPGDL